MYTNLVAEHRGWAIYKVFDNLELTKFHYEIGKMFIESTLSLEFPTLTKTHEFIDWVTT